MRHVLELALFLFLSLPLAVLPTGLSRRAGRLVGLLAYHVWRRRRLIALENLRSAVARGALDISGTPEGVIRENFRNMGVSLSEVIKVYLGFGGNILRDIEFEGIDNFEKARAGGRGVIFVTGHCANWEVLGMAMPARFGKVHGIARKQSNPYLDRFILKVREGSGGSVIYKQGALRKLLSILKEGGNIGVLMDQAVVPDEGVKIDFLGAPAWTIRTPAALARRTSSAVLPVFAYRRTKGYVIRVYPEVVMGGDETEDTKRISAHIEDYIRENPADWLWIHRRWKRAKPPGIPPA